MPAATQLFTSFLGGEISQYSQGRYDRPDYRTSLRVCLNAFPLEGGAWTRRPGTKYAGHTRGGAAGRVMKFDFEQDAPITKEYTDGYLRFRSGATLIGTNDDATIVAISSANPAVVQVSSAVTWATGNTVVFPGASTPLLENRQFTITVSDTTHFSLQDALTGANIDGSTLGALPGGTTVRRVHELTTVYVGQSWQDLRAVQAETTDVLLTPRLAPQILSVSTLPSDDVSPQFSIAPAVLQDGPYLDPPTNGAQVTPSALTGNVTLTLGFPAYVSTQAYAKDSFVSASGVNYKSLIDQNIGNTPVSSPSAWAPTSAGAAINDGRGFLGTDVGRLIRFYSEPVAWTAASSYSSGQIVSYNPTGKPGAATYWQAAASTTNNPPGSDLTHWTLITTNAAALWTWGKITGLSNVIDRALAGSTSIGNLTSGGGLAAAFDGNFSKSVGLCARFVDGASGVFIPPSTTLLLTRYVGKNYSGASAQKISQVTVYPSSDAGMGYGSVAYGGGLSPQTVSFTINLRAKNSLPVGSADGTLLGSATFAGISPTTTVVSNDQVTAWNYVWVEMFVSTTTSSSAYATQYEFSLNLSQVTFYSPTTSSSAGCTAEILGPALLYSQPITTWRLGAYSDTTGWPTCGCYDGGRLVLGGAIPNRWDACVSNGISGNTINFAPTDVYGVVAASNAISYTFNSDSVNPIFWMSPELQGIVMGTQAGEWLVQAPTSGALSPTNVSARRVTKIGCANIEPRRTEHTLIFIKRYARKLMEYFADVYSGKYSAPNLADKAQHIVSAGAAELAYTEAVTPVLWGRDESGSMFGVTYKRDSLASGQGPTFYAWHRHELGSDRVVESMCSGPSVNGDLDTLTMVTNDLTTNVRHVELLTDMPDETATLASSWFLDDAVNPTSITVGASSVILNGLWHLNGKTVQVFAGGLDLGDLGDAVAWSSTKTYGSGEYVKGSDRLFYVSLVGSNLNHDPTTDDGTHWGSDYIVSNGSVTVPLADGISAGPGRGLFTSTFASALALTDIVIGFTYNSDGQLVRLVGQADTGARNGPAMGAPSRTHRAAMKLVNAKGLSIGGTFADLYPCQFKMSGTSATDLAALSTFSGIFYDQVKSDFSYEDSLCWRVSRPFPCTITAAAQNLRTEDM
jgi:hypothetical protein